MPESTAQRQPPLLLLEVGDNPGYCDAATGACSIPGELAPAEPQSTGPHRAEER